MESSTRVMRRSWVRRAYPVWPFVWRGLLPLLGLLLLLAYAVLPFAHQDIEQTVLQRTRLALDTQGFGWVHSDVSGQNVMLSGEQPAAGDGDRALVAARQAACPSWAGALTCAIDVNGKFTDPVAVAQVASPAAPAAATDAQVQACEQQLTDLLAKSKIEFSSASAIISAHSAGLMDSLAAAAGHCPGNIRIEGHTDSVGSSAMNDKLSVARAVAVRDALIKRGVAEQRLRSEGFGAARPLADNVSAAGRAQNRRIEFHVIR